MKDIMEPASVQVTGEDENFANRKLIRPALPQRDHNHGNHNSNHNSGPQTMERRERSERHERPERSFDRGGAGGGRKAAPPDQTNAENFYYQKQMQSKTLMVVVLQDGEEIRGIIEWYDKNCIKLTRENGQPNLMIYKPAIKYMFKEDESQ